MPAGRAPDGWNLVPGPDTPPPPPYALRVIWPLPPGFSFISSILKVEPGRSARGLSVVPRVDDEAGSSESPVRELPPCLVTEAVGQLAAWASMAGVDFRRRPVAALAGELIVHGGAACQSMLEIEVDIDRCDLDTVAYHGRAWCGEACLVELRRSVGPLLAMEDFDDPAAVAGRFRALCEAGWQPPVPKAELCGLEVVVTNLEAAAGRIRAEIRVPVAAPWFAGHFPRRPVLPGTLLTDVQVRLAAEVARVVRPDGPGGVRLARVKGTKLRSFVPPGATITVEGMLRHRGATAIEVAFEGATDLGRVLSTRVELRVGEPL